MKKIHEITIEELVKSLTEKESTSYSVDFNNPIISFVQQFNIKSGKNAVPSKLLYNLYKVWNIKDDVCFSIFTRSLGTLIDKHSSHNYTTFYVSESVLEVAKKVQELTEKGKKHRHRSPVWIKHFQLFLEQSGLKEGSIYIESDILYYVYNRWIDATRKKVNLTEWTFTEFCRLHFKWKKRCRGIVYLIGVNTKIKELITTEEIQRWRDGRKRNEKEKKQKK